MKIDGTEYKWVRLDLPEGLEVVNTDCTQVSDFLKEQANAVVMGGLVIVKAKKDDA